MDKFCRTCGRPLDEETGFCPNCEPDLVRAARKHLPADDDKTIFLPREEQGVQEAEPQTWRQDILDDSPSRPGGQGSQRKVSDYEEEWTERPEYAGAAEPPSKKKKLLPVVLTALICFVAGAAAMHFIGGGGDDRTDSAQNTTGVTQEASTGQNETEETPAPSAATAQNDPVLEWNRSILSGVKSTDGPYFINQLIVTSKEGFDEEQIEKIKEDTGADVAAKNDYDRSILLQWSGEATEGELKAKVKRKKDELEKDSQGSYGVDQVFWNYTIDSSNEKTVNYTSRDAGEDEEEPWNLRKTYAVSLRDSAAQRSKEESGRLFPKIGFLQPASEGDSEADYAGGDNGTEAAKNVIREIIPDVESSGEDPFVSSGKMGETDSLYALTVQLTELIAAKDSGERCQLMCFGMEMPKNSAGNGDSATAPADFLDISLKALDEWMTNQPEQSDEDYQCLICYAAGNLDAVQWEEMESLSGISVGAVRQTADGKNVRPASVYSDEQEKGQRSGDITLKPEVAAPGEGIPMNGEECSGEILAAAHAAAFAADALTIDPDLRVYECKKRIIDSSNGDVINGNNIFKSEVKMLNGRLLSRNLDVDPQQQETDDR